MHLICLFYVFKRCYTSCMHGYLGLDYFTSDDNYVTFRGLQYVLFLSETPTNRQNCKLQGLQANGHAIPRGQVGLILISQVFKQNT